MEIIFISILIIFLAVMIVLLRKDKFAQEEDPENQDQERLDKEREDLFKDIGLDLFTSKDVIIDFNKESNDTIYNNLIDICGTEANIKSLFHTLGRRVKHALEKEGIEFDGVYLEKFVYTEDTHEVTVFVIWKHQSDKYIVTLDKNNEEGVLKKIERTNAEKPINRFLCNEGNDCSSRHSSLKPVNTDQNNFVPVVDKTALNKTFFEGDNSPILLLDRTSDYAVRIPKDLIQFPCRKNMHRWNKTSALNTQRATKKCKGIDSAYNKRFLVPRPHPSYFSNPTFWAKN